jgi:uncharacterized protein YehS (DUF1456 family)
MMLSLHISSIQRQPKLGNYWSIGDAWLMYFLRWIEVNERKEVDHG